MPSPSALHIHGRRYDNGEPVRVTIVGERIAAVDPAWPEGDIASWPYVAPGLFDLQINGYGGVWFSSDDLTPDKAAAPCSAPASWASCRTWTARIERSGFAAGHG